MQTIDPEGGGSSFRIRKFSRSLSRSSINSERPVEAREEESIMLSKMKRTIDSDTEDD
jgi:hypothetical protein